MWFLIFIVVVFFVGLYIVTASGPKPKRGQNVKVQFISSASGRTVHAGNGNSVGSAIVDGFSKMYGSVSPNSHEDTLRSKLKSMTRTLESYRRDMTDRDIRQCEYYINKVTALLDQKEAASRQAAEGKTEQQRYIAQQRRILSDSMRYDVMHRDNFRCVLCGASARDGVQLHVDHIIPLARGGKTEMSNLRTLCERCNLGKGQKIE